MFFQLFNLVYYIINIGKSNWFLKIGGVDLGVKFVMFYFWGEHREKKFVTFEKINSFKRGGVRAGLVGPVTIMTLVKSFRAQVGGLFFQK